MLCPVYLTARPGVWTEEKIRNHSQWNRWTTEGNHGYLLRLLKIDYCATREKNLFCVWSLMPEQSEGNNDTSKINVFPVSHTIFFYQGVRKWICVQTGGKSRVACLRVERLAANCDSAKQSVEMFIPPASTDKIFYAARHLPVRG